jgi:hypothetical protein
MGAHKIKRKPVVSEGLTAIPATKDFAAFSAFLEIDPDDKPVSGPVSIHCQWCNAEIKSVLPHQREAVLEVIVNFGIHLHGKHINRYKEVLLDAHRLSEIAPFLIMLSIHSTLLDEVEDLDDVDSNDVYRAFRDRMNEVESIFGVEDVEEDEEEQEDSMNIEDIEAREPDEQEDEQEDKEKQDGDEESGGGKTHVNVPPKEQPEKQNSSEADEDALVSALIGR